MARLSRLFERLDRVRVLELARTAAARATAEENVRLQSDACKIIATEQRRAAMRADDVERHVLVAAHGHAVRMLPSLHAQADAASLREEQAATVRRESRLAHERIAAVLRRAEMAAAVSEVRRTQAVMDDRFASRAAWQRTQSGGED